MNKKKIYIVRHGETEYNRVGIVQGRFVNAGLNQLGRMQARAFYEKFSAIHLDKIYTSTLKRTHQSVAAFIQDGIPWEQREGLDEISWGDKEGRAITPKDDIQYGDILNQWKNGNLAYKVQGGESPLAVQNRQCKIWRYIMSQQNEHIILVCMHGRAMKILLCSLLNIPLAQMEKFQHQNLCLYQLLYCNNSYEMVRNNYTNHLNRLRPKLDKPITLK